MLTGSKVCQTIFPSKCNITQWLRPTLHIFFSVLRLHSQAPNSWPVFSVCHIVRFLTFFFCEIAQCNSDIGSLNTLKSIIYGTIPTNLNPLLSMAELRVRASVPPPLCRMFTWRGYYLNTRRTNLLSYHSCLSH
jgi:hypothetical protein